MSLFVRTAVCIKTLNCCKIDMGQWYKVIFSRVPIIRPTWTVRKVKSETCTASKLNKIFCAVVMKAELAGKL